MDWPGSGTTVCGVGRGRGAGRRAQAPWRRAHAHLLFRRPHASHVGGASSSSSSSTTSSSFACRNRSMRALTPPRTC